MSRHIIRQEDIHKDIKVSNGKRKTDEELAEESYVNHDHPNTMENGTATFLYIIAMVVGTIFYDRWLIYIIASIIYFSFINRKKLRKKKWDKMQEEKKNKKE